MPATPTEVANAEAERDALLRQLEARAGDVAMYEAYYDGDHPLPGPPERMQKYREAVDAYRNLSRMGVTNYLPLVPNAPAERLRVIGFRFGEVENMRNDPEAWRIWQRNHLDADSGTLHLKALVTGQAFALVWPSPDGAQITVEHPSNCIVAYEPGSYRHRRAGLKSWIDEDERQYVVLYLRDPANVYKWRSKNAVVEGAEAEFEPWQPSGDDTWPIKNPFNNVSLVEFRANPDLKPSPYGGGRSEFGGVISIQDRINKTNFDMLVTAEFQAFRQRWAIGWTPANPNEGMKASMAHLMTFADDPGKVQVGEFSQADFTGFLRSNEAAVQSMAAITRTPAFYTLGGSISNISGDTLKALQAGLIAKTEAHRDNFSEAHEEVLALALLAEGNARGADVQTNLLWRDIEHRTWAETADAVVKMQALGVPREALWAMLPNVTPQDIERWRVMAADEALFAPEQAPAAAQGPPVAAFNGNGAG